MPSSPSIGQRRVGAHAGAEGVAYRVWAPGHPSLEAVVSRGVDTWRIPMERDADGYWSGSDEGGRPGTATGSGCPTARSLPDVASRFQPKGVHGPSECVDPGAFAWRCPAGSGRGGPARPPTSCMSARSSPRARSSGRPPASTRWPISESRPSSSCPWPTSRATETGATTGCASSPRPDATGAPTTSAPSWTRRMPGAWRSSWTWSTTMSDPRATTSPTTVRIISAATGRRPGGVRFNLDGERSAEVRAFLGRMRRYWLDEFRIDGLRLDATHAIPDGSERHILAEIAEAVTRGAALSWRRTSATRPSSSAGTGWTLCGPTISTIRSGSRLTGSRNSYLAAYRRGRGRRGRRP